MPDKEDIATQPVGSAHRATVVVPCYNEEARLEADTFVRFVDERPWLGLIFVDDGSNDGTGAVIAAAAERSERIRALSLGNNSGKAEAVRCGILAALEDDPALVGFWDADLATPLDEIERLRVFFFERPELEIVMGSRVKLLGRHIKRNEVRHYFGRIAATAVSMMLGIPVYDTQCGAKLFRATPQVRALFAEPFISRWVFDVEILARWLGERGIAKGDIGRFVIEVPLRRWVDDDGSKIRPRDVLGAPFDLWRIHRRYRR